LRLEDVDEDNHEQQVDEVHRLHQTDRQEEVLTRLVLDLGLAKPSPIAAPMAPPPRARPPPTSAPALRTAAAMSFGFAISVFPPGLG
jgi:hypothetical protein